MAKTSEYLILLNMLYQNISNGYDNKEELQLLMNEIEANFMELSKHEGYNPHYKDEMTQSFEMQMNNKLALLEEKIKNKHSLSTIQEQSKKIMGCVKEFWREIGFHYIHNMKINHMGTIEVQFGFSPDFTPTLSGNKISAKEETKKRLDKMEEDGFIFNEKRSDLIDCDSNKMKIKKLLEEQFPSCRIFSWETFIGNKDEQILRYLNVRITNI
jgi:hypothetical protein